jgi:hypothetical protein
VSVSGVFEVVGAFVGGETIEHRADLSSRLVDASRVGFARQRFHFGEHLFDWGEVREYGGRKNSLASAARIAWRTPRPLCTVHASSLLATTQGSVCRWQ